MSNLYNLEPQPTAKVLLTTTAGDILLELFAKQIPLASRNFLQLCLDGYYNGTLFHRLVPRFIVQGGDPTGTGSGGESSFDGEPFTDEFHSRLKFNRRGLLGMANTGKKDDNGSQFFLTLDKTEELQGKNTMFGRVVGDTIYNLMRIGEAELAEEGGERPLYPVKLTEAEILVNPFEDMVKRVRTAHYTTGKADKKKPKKKAGKHMLSFGGDDEDNMENAPVAKKPKFNPKLVNGEKENNTKLNNVVTAAAPASENTASKIRVQKASSSQNLKTSNESSTSSHYKAKAVAPAVVPKRSSRSPSPSTTPEPQHVFATTDLSKTNAQIAELKASMKRNVAGTNDAGNIKPKPTLQAMIPATSSRGRKRRHGGGATTSLASTKEERRVMDAFNSFKEKLEGSNGDPYSSTISNDEKPEKKNPSGKKETSESVNDTTQAPGDDEEANLCDLHFIANCQSCSTWDDPSGTTDNEDFSKGSADWMHHNLSFAKDRLGKDLEWKRKNEDELVVIDPREREKDIKGEKKERQRDKGVWGKSTGSERKRASTKR